MIALHTLANFQSLPKLIILIINYFYSHYRSDWQIALTKQNFSDTLIFFIADEYVLFVKQGSSDCHL